MSLPDPSITHAGVPGITFRPSWPVSFLTILPWKLIFSDVNAYTLLSKYIAKTKDTISKTNKFFATFGQLNFFIYPSLYFVQY